MATISSLTSLTSMYSITSCVVDDMDSLDGVYTAASVLATSLSTIPGININITATNNYIESLSDEQLAKFDEILKEKEDTFALTNEYKSVENSLEKPVQKVKIIDTKSNS